MPSLDKRFALVRDGQPWCAALMGGRASAGSPTFRICGNGTQDAFGQAEGTTDIEDARAQCFDLEEMVDAVLDADPGPRPAYDLDTLSRLLGHPKLLPDAVEAKRNGSRAVFWTAPGRAQVAVTTDAECFGDNSDSLALWSLGGGAFPEAAEARGAFPLAKTLDDLLG